MVFLVHGFLQDWYGTLRSKIVASVPCPACITAFYVKSSAFGRLRGGPVSIGAYPLQNVLQTFVEKAAAPLTCPQCQIRTNLQNFECLGDPS